VKNIAHDYYSSPSLNEIRDNFDDDTLYKVAVNDYVFDKTGSAFQNGDEITNTGIVLRDLAQDELELQAEIYTNFFTSNSILTIYSTYQIEEETTNP
jgi:hypothetical protein